MVGTLWADKVLPGDSESHRQERTVQKRQHRVPRHTNMHKYNNQMRHTFTSSPPHTHTMTQEETDRESSQKCSSPAPTYTHMSQADKHTWMCTWMHKQKCVRCFRPCHCVVNHKKTMSVTELPHLNLLLKLISQAEKPQEWWTATMAFRPHLEVAAGENSRVTIHTDVQPWAYLAVTDSCCHVWSRFWMISRICFW